MCFLVVIEESFDPNPLDVLYTRVLRKEGCFSLTSGSFPESCLPHLDTFLHEFSDGREPSSRMLLKKCLFCLNHASWWHTGNPVLNATAPRKSEGWLNV